MKTILISIKPEWAEKILNGEKTIEIRKTMPKCELPTKVYIYCTKEKSYMDRLVQNHNGFYYIVERLVEDDADDYGLYYDVAGKNGQVVAEFTLNNVDEFYVFENGSVQNWNAHSLDKSLLTYEQLSEYIGKNKKGYAWNISDLKIYDEPKELSGFGLKRAPQSWQYVKGELWEIKIELKE